MKGNNFKSAISNGCNGLLEEDRAVLYHIHESVVVMVLKEGI